MARLYTIVALTLCIAYVSGLKCYENEGEDPTGDGKDCGFFENACVLSFVKGAPEDTMRSCGNDDDEVSCEEDTGTCTCDTDLCNTNKEDIFPPTTTTTTTTTATTASTSPTTTSSNSTDTSGGVSFNSNLAICYALLVAMITRLF